MIILRKIHVPLQREFNTVAKAMNEVPSLFIRSWLLSPPCYLFAQRQPSVLADIVRVVAQSAAILHLHGLIKIALSTSWTTLWSLIPNPTTKGRLLVALGDTINPKKGKKIFGCAPFFDHAAKTNQSKYPWSQNVVSIGILKMVKGRWACSNRCEKPLDSTIICLPDCASTPLCLRYHPNNRNISAAGPESMATRWTIPQRWPMNSLSMLYTPYSVNLYGKQRDVLAFDS